MKKIISNDLETWAMISGQKKINMIYILQPNINWVKKKLSKYEKKIMFSEKNYLGEDFYKNYSSRDVYIEQKKFLELKCKKNGINFKDSNEWFNEFKENDEIFNDSSHLTDYGNEILSKNTQKFLV